MSVSRIANSKPAPKPPSPPPVKTPDANDHEDSEKPPTPQNVEQLGDGEVNPLNPAGDSLDKLIKLRINEDLWRAMLGDVPCLETQEACIKELQSLAVQNSRSLRAIDERINVINQKIEEARRNNQRTINLGVFEPLVQSWLKTDTVIQSNGQERKRGIIDRVFNMFMGGSQLLSGVNEILGLIGVPLFKNLGGGDAAAQQRTIAIADLQVKIAEVEKQRGDLADKIKETVLMQVLEFDVVRKDFQVSQEIARREVVRHQLLKVDYRFSSDITTQSYLGALNSLDRTKSESFRQWARLRSHLARIKILVLGDGDG